MERNNSMILGPLNKIENSEYTGFETNINYGNGKTFLLKLYTLREYGHLTHNSPESALLSVFVAAKNLKEREIVIDEEVSPLLSENLEIASNILNNWFGRSVVIPKIKCSSRREPIRRNVGKSASFLSGGVDSMALLAENVKSYDENHHKRVKYCFFVYGLDVGDPNQIPRKDVFQSNLTRLKTLEESFGITVIPVYTNARFLYTDWLAYEEEQVASILASVAHFFAPTITSAQIALDNSYKYIHPYGSHPWLNNYYSTEDVLIESKLEYLGRIDRLRIIKDLPLLIENIHVCNVMNKIPSGYVNCGVCRKCVRTILEMKAIGIKPSGYAFPEPDNASASLLINTRVGEATREYYEELLVPLKDSGYLKDAEIIEEILAHYNSAQALSDMVGWRQILKLAAQRIKLYF